MTTDKASNGRRLLAPARRGSLPVASWQRQRLGHADRARLMDAARRRERETRQPGSGRHGGELRQTGLRVLWALLYRGWGKAGACDPSLQQIADGASMARSAVQRALDRLEAAGILLRVRRGLVVAGRFAQVTNAYLFRAPAQWSPSDTSARSASESESKPEVLWEGNAPAETPDPAWLRGALERWGLLECGGAPAGVG